MTSVPPSNDERAPEAKLDVPYRVIVTHVPDRARVVAAFAYLLERRLRRLEQQATEGES